MKRVVTHKSADLDAITSVWLIKRFLTGWEDAIVEFVSAGDKFEGKYEKEGEIIEVVDGVETIHVDTGMGKLDHHQTMDSNVCGASLSLDYVLSNTQSTIKKHETKRQAVERMVDLVVDDDHFQDVYLSNPQSDIYDFGINGIIQGFKLMHPKDDTKLINHVLDVLDILLHTFEGKIWAENEIKEESREFDTIWGKGLAIESINDTVMKLGQIMGYFVVIRKDPKYGFVRIKGWPKKRIKPQESGIMGQDKEFREKIESIDLTSVYEKVKKLDPEVSWYLHVSKRMLLNGSSKSSNMKGTKLTLDEIIKLFETP